MPALLPPMVRLPDRASELGLALAAQDAVLPETDTEAQLTPELADAAEQSDGLGVMAIVPADPPDPTLRLDGFRL